MYKELLAMPDPDPLYYTYAAACEYYMGMYKEAEATALKVRHDKLQLSGQGTGWATAITACTLLRLKGEQQCCNQNCHGTML